MAYGGYGDYEWEEVEEEDWEVICIDDEEQKAGVPRTGIEFTLEDEGPQRRVKRTITKREREAAAAVHRSHVLCLLARALLLDWAAEQPEVQATALSLLPPSASIRNQSSEEPQRAINGLLPLVSWFRSTFAVLPPDVVWRGGGAGAGSRLRPEDEFDEQLLRTARGQAGTVECLVALFAALVRAQGGSARVARLLDAVPLAPWRARPVKVRMATEGPPPAAGAAAASGGGGAQRAVDLEAGDQLPAAAAAATAGGATAGSRVGGGKGGRKGQRLDDALADKGYGGGSGKGKKRKAAEGAEGGGGGFEVAAAGRSKSAPAAVGLAEGAAAREGGGAKRRKKGDGGGGGDGDDGGGGSESERKALAAGEGGGGGTGGRSSGNKGEDEFERQLQMALLATSREAEARQRAEASGGDSGSAAAAKANGGAGRSRSQPRGGGAGKAAGAGGGASTSVGAPVGVAMSVRPEVVVNCWAEVYCGSADRGRWVAVDVVNGYVDRPELIDSATQRPAPVCYVAAAERGTLMDVTPRYCHNLLAAHRNRDEAWWTATAAALHRAGGGCLGRGLPEAAAAAAAAGADAPSGQGRGATEAGTSAVAAPDVGAEGEGKGRGKKGAGAGAGGGGGPRIIDARLSHQRGEVENPRGPHAAAAAAAAAARAVTAGSSSGAPAAGAPGARSAAGDFSGVSSGKGGDLRAAREAAELQHRGLSQLQGLPTSIEGFKSHPLYVLKRHIGKYEALRPSTAPLGLHRGEPYYPRAQLSVLHTVERWRRDGRQVRDSELGSPAKVVKKRLMPGPPGPPIGAGAGARRAAYMPAGGNKSTGRAGGGGGGGEEDDDDVLLLEAAGELSGSGAGGSGGGDGAPTINLYGRWQTDEWVPPTAEDGRVPKNERGNVECPPLVPLLPRGTVHLTLGPGLGGVCRTLGVDFAPGLVGFEVQGGRMVPKLEGVVVCEEVSELVVAAYLEREIARAAAAAARARRAATAAWLLLLGAVRVRVQLERDYAGGGQGDGKGDGQGAAGASKGAVGTGAATAGGAAAAAAVAAAAAEAEAKAGRGGGGGRPRSAVEAAAAAAAAAGIGGPTAAKTAQQQQQQGAQEGAEEGTGADVEMEEF